MTFPRRRHSLDPCRHSYRRFDAKAGETAASGRIDAFSAGNCATRDQHGCSQCKRRHKIEDSNNQSDNTATGGLIAACEPLGDRRQPVICAFVKRAFKCRDTRGRSPNPGDKSPGYHQQSLSDELSGIRFSPLSFLLAPKSEISGSALGRTRGESPVQHQHSTFHWRKNKRPS